MKRSAVGEAGEGTTFQQRVSVHFLALLASEDQVPYADGVVIEVSFQVSNQGVLTDDQQVKVLLPDSSERYDYIQCKRSVYIRESDPALQETLARASLDIESGLCGEKGICVLAVSATGKLDNLNVVLATARGCDSIQQLSSRLDNDDTRAVLSVLRAALETGRGQQSVPDDQLLRLLKRFRVWRTDLLSEPSKDHSNIVNRLSIFTERRSAQHAAEILATMRADVGTLEAKRWTFSIDRLRERYAGLSSKLIPDPAAPYLSDRYVDELERQLRTLTAQRRERCCYESLKPLKELRDTEWSRYQSQSGKTGKSAMRIETLIAEAHKQIGSILHEISANHEEIRQWLDEFRRLPSKPTGVWIQVCRLAFELEHNSLVEEASQHVGTEERTLIAAKQALLSKDYENCLLLCDDIAGAYAVDAHQMRRQAFAELALSDPSKAINAWKEGLWASRIEPTRTMLKLVKGDAASILLSHMISPFSRSSTKPPPEWPSLVRECRQDIEDILQSECGQFERYMAAAVYSGLLGDWEVVQLDAIIGEFPEWLKLTSPFRLLEFARLALNSGRSDWAELALNIADSQPLDTECQAELARVRGALAGNLEEPVPRSGLSKRSKDILIAIDARNSFIKALASADGSCTEYAQLVSEYSSPHAVKCEVAALHQFSQRRFDDAKSKVEELLVNFPNAWRSWGVLSRMLAEQFRLLLAGANDESSLSQGVQALDPNVLKAFSVCKMCAMHSATTLQHSTAWYDWLDLCLAVEDALECDELSEAARNCGEEAVSCIAAAHGALIRGRFDEAIQMYDRAEGLVGLGSRSRHNRNVARLQDGRYQDIVDDLEEVLADVGRPPEAAGPVVTALRLVGRRERALEVARENLRSFPDDPLAMRIAADIEWSVGDTAKSMSLIARLAEEFSEEGGVSRFEIDDVPEELMQLFRGDDPQMIEYEGMRLPIHLISRQSVSRRFDYHTTTLNGISCHRRIHRKGVESYRSNLPVLLDITAVLSISTLRLWTYLAPSLQLQVPMSVVQSLRLERDELGLQRTPGYENRLRNVKDILENPKVRSIPWFDPCQLNPPRDQATLGELDEHLMRVHKAVECNTWSSTNTWSVPALIKAAVACRKLTEAQAANLDIALRDSFKGADWSRKVEGQLPNVILLSGGDVDALAQGSSSAAFLQLFDEVIVGPSAHHWLGRTLGPSQGIERGYMLACRALQELEHAIAAGYVVLRSDVNRPRCCEPAYLLELCSWARQGCHVWVDDSFVRALLANEAPGIGTISTLEMLEIVADRVSLEPNTLNDLGLGALLSGFRDVTWTAALSHAARTPAHNEDFEVLVRRLCVGLRDGFNLGVDDRNSYVRCLFENLLSVAKLDVGAEMYSRRATVVILDFLQEKSIGLWVAFFAGLSGVDGAWVEEFVSWASARAHDVNAFTYVGFIEVAKARPDLNCGMPIFHCGSDHDAFMRVWRSVRQLRQGIMMIRIPERLGPE